MRYKKNLETIALTFKGYIGFNFTLRLSLCSSIHSIAACAVASVTLSFQADGNVERN
jgi:hypothetical protein